MGGSTSVVKNKSTVRQVEPVHEEVLPEPIKCRKHYSNGVTHFCETTEELICLTCYERQKSLQNNVKDYIEIDEYVKSLKFKQSETRATDQLRNRKTSLEEELKSLDYHEKRSACKRREMLEEIHTFVGTLIELVKHLEQELCQQVNKTIEEYTTKLNSQREYVHTWHNELLNVQKDVTRHKEDGNKMFRLRSVLECKKFVSSLKSNVQVSNESSDFKLKLNKTLTLKDIVGSKRTYGHISLGEICRELDTQNDTHDTLSTITETDLEEDIRHTQLSATPETFNSSCVANGYEDHDIDNVDDNKTEEQARNDNSLMSNESSVELTNEYSGTLAEDMTENVGLNSIEHSTLSTGTQSEQALQSDHKKRQQFEKDHRILTDIHRSNSPTRSRSRISSTPRKSSHSLLSPGSVTTPSRIHLLPSRQAFQSAHGKMAVKTRTIIVNSKGNIPNFTDSVILNNGKIILCDQKNERLVLLGSDFKQLDEIQLMGQPHNITKAASDSKTIAVTIPDKNIIQFVWVVSNKLEETHKVLQTKPRCRGIEYIDNYLLYTSKNDVVVIKDTGDGKPWKFDCAFKEPVSLLADRKSKILYVCCIGLKTSGEVVKIHFDKEKIERVLSFRDIKHPVCCARDNENNVYICDIDPPRIHLVSPSGQYRRVVLDSMEGNLQHLNFLHGNDAFFTTENNSGEYVARSVRVISIVPAVFSSDRSLLIPESTEECRLLCFSDGVMECYGIGRVVTNASLRG